MKMSKNIPYKGYALATALVALLAGAGYQLRPPFSEIDIIMLFLVGAVVAAASLGRGPALLYSALSVSAFNYFFVEPRFTFDVSNPSYWLTFAVMFFACLVISTLAARLREQVVLSRRRETEARMLYELVKELAALPERQQMAETLLRHITAALPVSARLKFQDGAVFGALNGSARHSFSVGGGTLEISALTELPADQLRIAETGAGLLSAALERVETTRAAEQAKIMAEKEKARSTLLSSVSHDLRTPLAAISGAAETLLQTSQDNSLLKSIHKEAGRVTRIVTNLLDITRIEGGHIKLNMRGYDPAEIIGSAVEACRETLKGHPLELHVALALPFVRMDGLLISQLIQNLLENAAHHTPAGTTIGVDAYIREGSFCLAVWDNGAGIPAGQEKEIFAKFATSGKGDRPKGAGLGLAICQAITAAHQGRIYAHNRPEGGCRFVLELPPQLTLPLEQETANAG